MVGYKTLKRWQDAYRKKTVEIFYHTIWMGRVHFDKGLEARWNLVSMTNIWESSTICDVWGNREALQHWFLTHRRLIQVGSSSCAVVLLWSYNNNLIRYWDLIKISNLNIHWINITWNIYSIVTMVNWHSRCTAKQRLPLATIASQNTEINMKQSFSLFMSFWVRWRQ